MNRKASETLWDNAIYFILAVIFFSGLMYYILNQKNGASIWEDYYAKEISRVINLAKPGDVITLDIHKATEIAQKNKLSSNSEIFTFDNKNNEICVKLSLGRKKCYSYFNNVDIINQRIEFGVPINILKFDIWEKQNE